MIRYTRTILNHLICSQPKQCRDRGISFDYPFRIGRWQRTLQHGGAERGRHQEARWLGTHYMRWICCKPGVYVGR